MWYGSALNRPIEENCTVFTNVVRDKPSNSARRHVVAGLIGPDRMVTTFFKVVAGSIPVTGDDVGMVTKSQCDEISHKYIGNLLAVRQHVCCPHGRP